jgi:hypothetical protein
MNYLCDLGHTKADILFTVVVDTVHPAAAALFDTIDQRWQRGLTFGILFTLAQLPKVSSFFI